MAHAKVSSFFSRSAWIACVYLTACAAPAPRQEAALPGKPQAITSYRPHADRVRPIVAVVGENSGVEVSDFLVPFGILSRAGTMEVLAVSTVPGPIATFTDLGQPGFRVQAQTTIADFDARYPAGADYVVVPAQASTPRLIGWLTQQTKRGATLVTICNGALLAAETGQFAGRRATAHWSTASSRARQFPDIRWASNTRYIADGNWISTAGVSAAIPASIALVDAISGHERATAVAEAIGVTDWSPAHDSDAFRPRIGRTAWPLAKVIFANKWLYQPDAIEIAASVGADEAALALTVDAYSSTGRSHAYLTTETGAPLATRHGLVVLPDRPRSHTDAAADIAVQTRSATALDTALDGIMRRYGHATAAGVALVFEYPGYRH